MTRKKWITLLNSRKRIDKIHLFFYHLWKNIRYPIKRAYARGWMDGFDAAHEEIGL